MEDMSLIGVEETLVLFCILIAESYYRQLDV